MSKRILTPLEYLVLYVVGEAQEESELLNEEFGGVTDIEITQRVNDMALERKINLICEYYNCDMNEAVRKLDDDRRY